MKNKRRECKRAAAMLLAALMVLNSVDLSTFTAYAAQSENSNVMTITGFEELEEGYEASVTIDGETQNYTTLEEAFSAAEGKTATITMLNDAECIGTEGSPLHVNNNNSNITLGMNGKTLSGNGMGNSGIIDVRYGTLLIRGSGKVTSTNIGLSTEAGNGNLTVEDITVDVSSGSRGFYIGKGTVTLNNVQITGQAENQAVYLCGGDTTLNNVSVTESDVYYYSKGTLKINSGTFAKISVKDGNAGNIKTVLRFLGNGCSYRYMDEDKT